MSGMSLVLAVMLIGGRLVFPGSDKGHSGAAKDEVWKGFWPGTVLDSIRSNKNNAALLLVAANTLVIIPAILYAIVDHAQERFSTMIFWNVSSLLKQITVTHYT